MEPINYVLNTNENGVNKNVENGFEKYVLKEVQIEVQKEVQSLRLSLLFHRILLQFVRLLLRLMEPSWSSPNWCQEDQWGLQSMEIKMEASSKMDTLKGEEVVSSLLLVRKLSHFLPTRI